MDPAVELGEAGGLAYRSAGSGRPLVLLHPGPGLDGSVSFREVLALTEWTVAGFARSVVRAVRALGLEPRTWDLLGHSFGGFVAPELNNLHPGELTRRIASCTIGSEEPLPGGVPGELDRLSEDERTAIEAVWQRESYASTPETLRDAWLDQVDYWAGSPAGAERLRERWLDVTFQPGPDQHEDWGELEALEALAGIPVLSIAAEHDPIPLEFQRRIADASPRGALAVIDGTGHFPFVETPDRYWPVVARWLEETGP